MARGHNPNDYGAPTTRSNKLHRPLIIVNHVLHIISSIVVLGIAGYFIHNYSKNTHLIYWVVVAAIDVILYLPALVLPAVKSYKGYLAPLAWIFSYLWLTAFIFAAQDYEYGNCEAHSPGLTVNKCSVKKSLEAFAFIAFFTSLVGTLLEGRLWDVNRFKGANHTYDADKHHAGTTGVQPVATAPHATV